MASIIFNFASLIISFYVLFLSADRFIKYSEYFAIKLKISKILIGIIILGFGSSVPELLVSVIASYNNKAITGVGNVIGSNIYNIGLILGISAIIRPLILNNSVLKKEWRLLFIVSSLVYILLSDNYLHHYDGIVLILFFILIICSYLVNSKPKSKKKYDYDTSTVKYSFSWLTFYIIISLTILLISSEVVVWSATKLASNLGISSFIIGLTVIALGTSLPELIVSVISIYKNKIDLLIGNILGSNIFNYSLVLGSIALVQYEPTFLKTNIITRDLVTSIFLVALLFIVSINFHKKNPCISRFGGFLLFSTAIIYIWILILFP